jgi:hypothetical protein
LLHKYKELTVGAKEHNNLERKSSLYVNLSLVGEIETPAAYKRDNQQVEKLHITSGFGKIGA